MLEEKVEALTTAVNALTKALENQTATISSMLAAGATAKACAGSCRGEHEDAKEARAPGKSVKTEKPADTQPTAPATAAPETKADNSGAIDFAEQIQKPIVKLAGTGHKPEALAILKECGEAPKASAMDAKYYAKAIELIAAANAKIAQEGSVA